QRRRGDELDRLKGACQEREEGVRAELDVCERTRARAEEGKARLGEQLANVGATRGAELAERDRLLEECRGRAADLEAHNLLLAAEKQGAEREGREKLDELSQSYGDLLASARGDLAECQGTGSGGLSERARERERAAAAEKATRLLEGLRNTLREDVEKGAVALSSEGARVVVTAKASTLFAANAADVKASARKMLKALAGAVTAVGDRAVVLEESLPPPRSAKDKARPPAPLSAARVVSALREGGLDAGRIAVVKPAAPARSDAVTLAVVPYDAFQSLFSVPAAPPAPAP
ncbi:MAG: hypothetical protein HGA98_00895, partial [Deltaproteobacteria bacterium]|nr:hypothetical protein [Deltaproteobacteria bacterium]